MHRCVAGLALRLAPLGARLDAFVVVAQRAIDVVAIEGLAEIVEVRELVGPLRIIGDHGGGLERFGLDRGLGRGCWLAL